MFELLERPATSFSKGNIMSKNLILFAAKIVAGAACVAAMVVLLARCPVSDQVAVSSNRERLPVVFAEQDTGTCVAAFRRGTESDWNGITGVSCLAVVTERKNGQVIEKVVPKGTKFAEVMEQFLYNDPWQDEFVPMESS